MKLKPGIAFLLITVFTLACIFPFDFGGKWQSAYATDVSSDSKSVETENEGDEELISIADAEIELGRTQYVYSGTAKKPYVDVYLDGWYLQQDVDYTVSYWNNIKAGTAIVVVTGIGDYTDQTTCTFKITRKTISKCKATIPAKTYFYTGNWVKPKVTVKDGQKKLVKGRDYSVGYRKNKNVGKAKVVVTGKGNYRGTVTKIFRIVKKKISKKKVTISVKKYPYIGKKIKPAVTVKYGQKKLVKGRDYSVRYRNNKRIGTARVIVKGKGKYKGTVIKKFRIVKNYQNIWMKKTLAYYKAGKFSTAKKYNKKMRRIAKERYVTKMSSKQKAKYRAKVKSWPLDSFDEPYLWDYYLTDYNNDGKADLIILTGTCEADAVYRVYTYRNGKLKRIGKLSGGHASLSAYPGTNGIVMIDQMMGYETIWRIYQRNGKTVRKKVNERETSNYMTLRNKLKSHVYYDSDYEPHLKLGDLK